MNLKRKVYYTCNHKVVVMKLKAFGGEFMERPLRIAIDMDGVIADHLTKQLSYYNRDYADQLTFADLQGKKR
jgi:hypothetical protein